MRILFVFLFFSTQLYAYTPGFESAPLNPDIEYEIYYLKPFPVAKKQKFSVIKCIYFKTLKKKSSQKHTKPLSCSPVSLVHFSLSALEAIAIDLEKWNPYYLGLNVAVFVGLIFGKIRNWIWRNPIGRVVGVLALTGEISDFVEQKKQSLVYVVISKIDQKQIELQEKNQYRIPKSLTESEEFLTGKKPLANSKKDNPLLPNKSWISLEGFDAQLIRELLKLLSNA